MGGTRSLPRMKPTCVSAALPAAMDTALMELALQIRMRVAQHIRSAWRVSDSEIRLVSVALPVTLATALPVLVCAVSMEFGCHLRLTPVM